MCLYYEKASELYRLTRTLVWLSMDVYNAGMIALVGLNRCSSADRLLVRRKGKTAGITGEAFSMMKGLQKD